jgi:RNA polymerase sigma-70 factor (ECF subfamily)
MDERQPARSIDGPEFSELAEAYRAELQLHCYRILGSVQDGEDLVQETLLAAWRSLQQFEGRATLRTWLYRIATNRCLNALRARGRRPPELPPSDDAPEVVPPTRFGEALWLEPFPDLLLEDIETREAVGLAFITALQRLPPKQRVVLVLRDVLGFRAREVAEMIEMTEVAVNRALQRARIAVGDAAGSGRDLAPLPESREERELVAQFVEAFESGDVAGVVAMLSDDALLTMPPTPLEYEGQEAIGRFLSTVPGAGKLDRFRLVPTRANGQPAFGCYLRDAHTPIAHAYGLMVLTLANDRVVAITGFPDTSLFARFGLPRTLRG